MSRSSPLRRGGSALVITLAILVLVTSILLAFFSQSSLNRQISFSSGGQLRADLVARAALDAVTGDLRDEIVSGSKSTAAGTDVLYIPRTNAVAVPCRVKDQGFPNLVKQSAAGLPAWSGPGYAAPGPVRAAPGSGTFLPAAGGRFVKAARWNKAGLLGDPGSGSTPQVPASYVPPDWIVVTRRGPVTNAVADLPPMKALADASPSNADCAVGRFAYAVYDEGALLDANVAGFPNSARTTDFPFVRGVLPQVDLSGIPGVRNADGFVRWRNQATALSAASYTNSVSSATNGFLTAAAAGDQALVGRQDLIDYVQAHTDQIQTSALPYLGTSTRDLDGPSFFPDPNRRKVGAQDDVANPSLLKIRVASSFLRADGTRANPGEPLLKHRFPLSRLALFADPDGNKKKLAAYFCLQRAADGQWDWVDPDTGAVSTVLPTIKTLDQVALAGREPTFWEVLQAGILLGSLGANQGNFNGFPTAQDANATRQLLAIGLNLIDQYDADDTPTVLRLGGLTPAVLTNLSIVGVENLPYLSWIAQDHFRDNQTVLTPSTNAWIDAYLFFVLWNPHRNAASATPGKYRFRFSGQTSIRVYNRNIPSIPLQNSATVDQSATTLTFQTSAARTFSQPDALTPADAVMAETTDTAKFPYPAVTGVAPYEVGLFAGQVALPKTPEFPSSGNTLVIYYPNYYANSALFNSTSPLTIWIEKWVSPNWIPCEVIPQYQIIQNNSGVGFATVTGQLNQPNGFTNNKFASLIGFAHADPRSFRFGLSMNGPGVAQNMLSNNFNLVDASGAPFGYTQITVPAPPSLVPQTLADYAYNASPGTGDHAYADPDAVIRKADSSPATTASHLADSPYSTANSDNRPVVLNRAFRSVAEMGYAFRDTPWRTLDFSSATSADGGLLDLFCLNENQQPLRSGVLDLNGAAKETLAAVLLNAYRDPATGGTPLAAADASTIAQAIRAQLGPASAPLVVVRTAADLPALAAAVASSLPDRVKFKREAVARSFADVANGRTWNLMIDVIAQAGRYGKGAGSLADFIVEGERRYWLHVAIDRMTGRVVDQQLEAVRE